MSEEKQPEEVILSLVQEGKELTVSTKSVKEMIDEMGKVVVDSQEKYDWLLNWVRRNKETQKIVIDATETKRVEAKAKYDAVLTSRSILIKPLETAEKVARDRMTEWSTAQEKKRREEEAAVRATLVEKKEDDKIMEAETLQAMGRTDAAEALMDKKTIVTKSAVAAVMTTAKVGKTIEKWEVKVTDVSKLLAEASGIPDIAACITISESALAAFCKKSGTKALAGCTVEQKFVPVL